MLSENETVEGTEQCVGLRSLGVSNILSLSFIDLHCLSEIYGIIASEEDENPHQNEVCLRSIECSTVPTKMACFPLPVPS